MKKILIIIMILFFAGCATSSQIIVKNKECHVPARVELQKLDNSTHLASNKNAAILMLNIADLVAYIKSLESAIKCYEKQ